MNPANYREALIEARADESEGADILLVGVSCFIIRLLLVLEPPVVMKLLQLDLRLNQGCLIWIL